MNKKTTVALIASGVAFNAALVGLMYQSTHGDDFVITETAPTTTIRPSLKLDLTEQQRIDFLGIGDVTPIGGKTYSIIDGWQGPAAYNFPSVQFTTPHLVKEQQLNNWNYVIFRRERNAIETNGVQQPPSDAIRGAVDKEYYINKMRRKK